MGKKLTMQERVKLVLCLQKIFTHIWNIKNELLNLHGARLLGHPA